MRALCPRGGAKITHLGEAAAHHTRYRTNNCKCVVRAIGLCYACLEGKRVKTVSLNHLGGTLLAVAAAGLLAAVGLFMVVLYAQPAEANFPSNSHKTTETTLRSTPSILTEGARNNSPTTPPTTAPLPTHQAVRRSPSRATTETTMKSTRSTPVGVVGSKSPTTVLETLSLTGAVNSDFSLLVAPEK
jgi:cytoskeletal protein RodZ